MLILAIESSCDETAVAVVNDRREVLANLVASQIDLHRQFGGVVPEVAARAHLEVVLPLIAQALAAAGIAPSDLDAIAVTHRPGLIGALLIGVTAAKTLSWAWNKPLIGVNHLEAHLAAATFAFPEITYPYVALIVSGGHTNLFHVPAVGVYEKIGGTLDDAAGEAFDKAAKILGLGFPGGPAIAAAAERGNPAAFNWRDACLPRKNPRDFSFSGIKTGVLYAARGLAGRRGELLLDEQGVADAAASFQFAAVRALVKRTVGAAREKGVRWLAVGGGVAANRALREAIKVAATKIHCQTAIPPFNLCTDNAVMIAARGIEMFAAGEFADLTLDAAAR
ncbi:tRNA N6-adenosine threonylcarbamoyltransferase [Planctomycetales bacterium]|nr:tRNA N6-adenosine threonylcarbamoyltransferase [Planctomycetales bacterium]